MQQHFDENTASAPRRALVVTHARLDSHSAVVNQVTSQLTQAGFLVDVFHSAAVSDFSKTPTTVSYTHLTLPTN